MELSLIIPIYNVEKYLPSCINSVLRQNLSDYEIILVDDGSPDNCPAICDDYALKYDFIRVIHKPNGGLSSARNAGVLASCGDYIVFLDSDDWWNPRVDVRKMLEQVKANPSVDFFLFTSLDYLPDKGWFKRREHEKLKDVPTDSVDSYYRTLLMNGNLEVHAGTKIINRNFFIKNNLFFKEGIISEDNEWMIRMLRVVTNVEIIDQSLYIYRLNRPGSLTSTVGIKNLSDLLDIIQQSIDYCKSNDDFKFREYELCYCAYLWFSALGLSSRLKKSDKAILKGKFSKTSEVCRNSNSPKTKLAYTVYRLFGLGITSFILGRYIALKGKKRINKIMVDDLNTGADYFC